MLEKAARTIMQRLLKKKLKNSYPSNDYKFIIQLTFLALAGFFQ